MISSAILLAMLMGRSSIPIPTGPICTIVMGIRLRNQRVEALQEFTEV